MVFAAAFPGSAAAGNRPVVVELFTSQGCSSCPPADRVLGELADRPDVLALSFHVTYWDRLGWPDSLGLEAATERQYGYAQAMNATRVYTPQMVVDGRVELVGSRRAEVLDIVRLLATHQGEAPDLHAVDGELRVGAGTGRGTVWLAAFDARHEVAIGRGENAGRSLPYHNVVRELRPLGVWQGEAIRLPLDRLRLGGRDGVALLLQADDGRILNALRLDLGS